MSEVLKQVSLLVTCGRNEYESRFQFPAQTGRARNLRSAAGGSSVRVDNDTLARLKALAKGIELALEANGTRLRRPLSMVELLTVVATADVVPAPDACKSDRDPPTGKKKPRGVHAKTGKVHARSAGKSKALPPILKEIDRLAKQRRRA